MRGLASFLLLVATLGVGAPSWAELALPLPPGAEQTARTTTPYATYALPVGPWENGKTPAITLTGVLTQQAWRLPATGPDTLKLAESLRAGLVTQGYGAIFACATDACGGFDFRYETDFLPEPEMHVDLSDFRYLSAVRGQGPKAEYVGLMVSRAGDTGFVQLTHIGGTELPASVPLTPPSSGATASVKTEPSALRPAGSADVPALADALENVGHIVLPGLHFASGSAELQGVDPESLHEVAAYLQANPEARLLIVGHTDVSGGLEANVVLSRQRAQAVVDRLIADYGVSPGQLGAEGAGPLAPLTTNLTPEGREKNRRVEAVLSSTR